MRCHLIESGERIRKCATDRMSIVRPTAIPLRQWSINSRRKGYNYGLVSWACPSQL